MTRNKYTEEQKQFLRDNFAGTSREDMTAMFNARFGTSLPLSKVIPLAYRLGLKNGRLRLTQFRKGHATWHKGKKHPLGEKHPRYRPVGSEHVDKRGYIIVKVADPSKWRRKHTLVWEEAHGPAPKGHTVIFADRDHANCSLDNLILVSRAQLGVMNRRGLCAADAGLTRAGKAMAETILLIGKRKREVRRGAGGK